jgi:hypothetical protein
VPPATGGPPKSRPKTAEELAAEQGVKPIEDFAKFLEEVGDVWPEEEEIDQFLIWLWKMRNQGRGTELMPANAPRPSGEVTTMSTESKPINPPEPVAAGDWESGQSKGLEELAAEPDVPPVTDFEQLLGQGDDLWADDAEFEEFLAWLRRSRQEGRSEPLDV